jgi:CheY-like chemotaxis protein
MDDSAPKLPVRVLVVDDEAIPRQVTERAFRNVGCHVSVASNGHEALTRIEQSQTFFDLFVLDSMMPAMTGTELAERIRRRQPDAKILYLTGFSDTLFSNNKKMLNSNEAFIQKPSSVKGMREAASLLLFGHIRGLEQPTGRDADANG